LQSTTMLSSEHTFLFASLEDKKPLTARKVHIRRLYDILQLCLQRNDIPRAKQAWAILSRCKEVDWKTMWTTAVHLLGNESDDTEINLPRLDFLRAIILQNSEERETIFKELILRLIISGGHREALDELELYLPSFPYQDNPVFHIYAGLLCIYLSQPALNVPGDALNSFDAALLRDAQTHLEHAKALDPDSVVANGFLKKLPTLLQKPQERQEQNHSDDETTNEDIDGDKPRHKRTRN